jgi:hypothetical protein
MLSRPILAMVAITLGLPFLILVALVVSSSGISTKAFTSVLTIIVLSSFVTLMIFEIKRIADQSLD